MFVSVWCNIVTTGLARTIKAMQIIIQTALIRRKKVVEEKMIIK